MNRFRHRDRKKEMLRIRKEKEKVCDFSGLFILEVLTLLCVFKLYWTYFRFLNDVVLLSHTCTPSKLFFDIIFVPNFSTYLLALNFIFILDEDALDPMDPASYSDVAR